MGYTTFKKAREWVEKGYGDCTPEVTGEVVNAIREHWFNWYDEIALFLDAMECFAVKTFCVDCNTCQDSYLGVTLPREFQNTEAVWLNDWPVRIHNSWREYQEGLTPYCDCRLSLSEVMGSFSTFDDIAHGTSVQLQLVATDPADAGKQVLIRGIDNALRPHYAPVTLGIEPVQTTASWRSIDPRGGIVKDVTKGRVILMDSSGKMYGRYDPDETVPSYRRVKINGLLGHCEAVNIRGARRYFPLLGDDDVVETDNRMAFDAMARYLREFRRLEKTQSSMLAEKDALATARKMIIGNKTREEGRATQVDVQFATPTFSGRSLTRNRYR
jgi:hypothetical protein